MSKFSLPKSLKRSVRTTCLEECSGHDDVSGPVDGGRKGHGAAFARGRKYFAEKDPDDWTKTREPIQLKFVNCKLTN